MELLCPAPAEGWLKECYLELAHRLFPDPARRKLSSGAAQAMEFYLTVLRWFLDTEPGRCPYDPLTDIPKVKTGGSGTFDYTYDSKHNLTEATNSTVKEKYTYDAWAMRLPPRCQKLRERRMSRRRSRAERPTPTVETSF